MERERTPIPLNEIEIATLAKKLDFWGIKTVAFDFDGTLIKTESVFDAALLDVSGLLIFGNNWTGEDSQLEQAMKFETEIIRRNIRGISPEFGVNPVVHQVVIFLAARERGLGEQHDHVALALQRTSQIYDQDIPEVFDDAHQVVDLINTTGRRTILITHAQEKWTQRKLAETGFLGKFEAIRCLSIYKSKSSQQEQTIRELGINPVNLLAVGDNLLADLQVPVQLGARGVLVGNRRPYSGETIPREFSLDSFIRINEISELPQAILDN